MQQWQNIRRRSEKQFPVTTEEKPTQSQPSVGMKGVYLQSNLYGSIGCKYGHG